MELNHASRGGSVACDNRWTPYRNAGKPCRVLNWLVALGRPARYNGAMGCEMMMESEARAMRIESTYTFQAPVERVYDLTLDPDALRRAVPGCERLIQLGPAADDGAVRWEVRVRSQDGAGISTIVATISPVRRPQRLEVDAHGRGRDGPFVLHGSLDFAPRDAHTVLAYVWDVTTREPDGPEMPATAASAEDREDAGARFAQQVCDGLGAVLRGERMDGATLAEALPVLRADTARGKIVLLPPDPPDELARQRTARWVRRGTWVAAGLLVGIAAIALAGAIIRRWGGQNQ